MKNETSFCSECGQETTHIEGECIDCSFKKDPDLGGKLEEDAEALERVRLESRRRPK